MRTESVRERVMKMVLERIDNPHMETLCYAIAELHNWWAALEKTGAFFVLSYSVPDIQTVKSVTAVLIGLKGGQWAADIIVGRDTICPSAEMSRAYAKPQEALAAAAANWYGCGNEGEAEALMDAIPQIAADLSMLAGIV